MEKIISKLYTLIKGTDNLIDWKEQVRLFMYEVFSSVAGEVFTQLNQAIKTEKQKMDCSAE